MRAVAALYLATILSASHAWHVGKVAEELPIHPLRLLSGSGGHHVHGISCESWRLAVETNNIRDWKTVPAKCEDYVGHYMLGHLYRRDSMVVAEQAAAYAASLKLKGDGKEIWVFDIDETVLSNLPYYAMHGFGIEPYNATQFNEWVDLTKAPALPESLKLYRKLLKLGIKVVFLTGRNEFSRNGTEINLKKAGYQSWEKVILRQPRERETAVIYKSRKRKQLKKEGYKIIGNMGDQWSDILGIPTGRRIFKLPDPMYYIS